MKSKIYISILFFFTVSIAYPVVRTWTGGGTDANWTNPANWGGTAPDPFDDLVFTGLVNTNTVNDFAPGTSFRSIKLTGAFGVSSNFTLSGNGLIISGGTDAIVNDGGTEGTGGYNLTINNSIFFTTADPTISLANTTANTISINGSTNNNSRTITIDNIGNNTNVTISGVISGIGGLIKNGTGTLLLSGTNTYSGTSTLNTGIIKLNNSQSFGLTGTVIINGGELDTYPNSVTLTDHPMIWNSNFSMTGLRNINLGNGPVTMTTDITIYVVNAKLLTVGGPISGDFSLTKTGLGVLELKGANIYTKTTTVSAGTIRLGNASALGTTASGTVLAAGGILDLFGQNYTNAEPLTINTTATGAIINSSATAGSFDGLITLGSSSYINANVGNINITNNGSIAGNGFELHLGGPANGTLRNVIATNAGTVLKDGTGIWTLTRNNSYTGNTTVNAGTLVLQGNYRSQLFTIATGSVLELNRPTDIDYTTSTTFAGSGTLRKTGAGTVVWEISDLKIMLLSGSLIDIQGGIFKGGGFHTQDWSTNLSDLTVASGAEFAGIEADIRVDAINGSGKISSGWVNEGSLTFGVDNGTGTFTGVIHDYLPGTGNIAKITKVGTGTQTLSGACTYSGTTTISAGELKLGADEVLPNGTPLTVNGTLNLNSHSETVGSITGSGFIDNLTGAGTPTFIFGGNNQTTDFAGVLKNTTGVLNVTKTGTGKIYLDGNNTYYGQTYVEDGFLELRNGTITSN